MYDITLHQGCHCMHRKTTVVRAGYGAPYVVSLKMNENWVQCRPRGQLPRLFLTLPLMRSTGGRDNNLYRECRGKHVLGSSPEQFGLRSSFNIITKKGWLERVACDRTPIWCLILFQTGTDAKLTRCDCTLVWCLTWPLTNITSKMRGALAQTSHF